MNVGDLKKYLEEANVSDDYEIFIPIYKEGSIIGGKPRIKVVDVHWDFDWNRGFWIIPEHQLEKVIR